MRHRQRISVDFEYDVVFTRDVFSPNNGELASVVTGGQKVVFFVDNGVAERWPSLRSAIREYCEHHGLDLAAPVQLIGGGEDIKNSLCVLDHFGRLAAERGLDRHSYVVIVGGGAVLDAVGFAASTVHRGIRQIRIPTTVLSQGDSAMGVKNGLNRFGQKNYYGAFAPPRAVLVDSAFLRTLQRRDLISGLSEAFKVGIIRDRELLDFLIAHAEELCRCDEAALERAVRASALIHLDHIRCGGDAFESGNSRPLDFGHWVAHHIEAATGYALRHGEAVAIGVALDLCIAADLGLVSREELESVLDAMQHAGLELWHDILTVRAASGELKLLAGLERFREHLGGELTLAMPDGLGNKRDIHALPREVVESALTHLMKRDTKCGEAARTSLTV